VRPECGRFAAEARTFLYDDQRTSRSAMQRIQTTQREAHGARLQRLRNHCDPREQKISREGKKTLASMVHRA
jgi:hypothetical protein